LNEVNKKDWENRKFGTYKKNCLLVVAKSKQHDGELKVETKNGEGSVFIINLNI